MCNGHTEAQHKALGTAMRDQDVAGCAAISRALQSDPLLSPVLLAHETCGPLLGAKYKRWVPLFERE